MPALRVQVGLFLKACTLALLWLAVEFPASAADPRLSTLTPPGGRRGSEVEVTLTGARLNDSPDILFYDPGVSLKKVDLINENSIKARLAIAPDCRMGSHAVRVRTATGISNLFIFSVGALEETAEVEPNSEFAKPQPLKLDVTVNGIVQNEDVDYFAVAAKKGERITAEVEGIRLGRTRFDPYVAILDKDRFELANSDDAALLWQDAVASLIAPEDGSYVIQVRESSFGGDGNSNYRLHVGHFPRPRAVIPAGARPGETVELRWLGDVGGEFVQKFVVPKSDQPYSSIFIPDDRAVALFAQNNFGIAPTPNFFRIGDLGNVIEAEPNNENAVGTPFQPPLALNGVIGEPGDVDCFRFKAKKGDRYDIHVRGRSIRSPLDSVLKISRIGGAGVAANDDSGSPDSYLRFVAPVDDEYVISVTDLLKQGGVEYAYRIEVAPIVPALTLGLPERVQYEDVETCIPQGNRMAFLVSAARRDFGGELKVDLQGLPKGVTVETMPMAANQGMVPVLVTAAADAPLAGTLADVVARSTDPKQPVEGHLVQTSLLVRGDNNRPVWTHTTHRMATAVTAKAPFSIEIVQPKAPLVRNGQMELKIKAIRDKGYTAPINVRMLYNPPGIGSSGGVAIPEGKDEAAIQITANNGAEIGSWKIAVIAEAQVGNGAILLSSQLAKLDVADSYFQFAFKPAAAEQGKEATIVAGVTNNAEFPGKAQIELVGLPAEVTAESTEITKDATEMTFKVKTSAKSPAGRHKAIMCRAVVTINGEPVLHVLGPAELRIDAPLPPKPKPVAAKPVAPPPAAVAAKPVAKPLSRLEQLRLEREGNKGAEKPAANQK